MNVHPRDLEDLITGAFRYALGRKSYVVGATIDLIQKYEKCLSASTRELMKRDINRAIELDRAGMDIDVADWRSLLEVL